MNRLVFVVGASLLLPAASALAAVHVEIDYQGVSVVFNPSGTLTITQNEGSQAVGLIKNGMAQLDRADIFNQLPGLGSFQLNFSGLVVNSGGMDDISVTGAYKATDAVTTLANPSLAADFTSANLGGPDPDGVSFSSGVLRIEGYLATMAGNSSILVAPAAGDWVYTGKDDGPVGPGLDGVADTLTVNAATRNGFDRGLFAVLEISLRQYADGTAIGNTDADGLFTMALEHGGFMSPDAQLQVSIVPAPAAALLGMIGFATLGWFRRRLA